YPIVDRNDAYASVGDRVVTDGTERPESWKYYLYSRQFGVWPQLVAGLDPVTQRDALRSFSPTYAVDGAFPPALLIHGTLDPDVPHEESVRWAALFALHGVEHEFLSLDGFDHGLAPDGDPDREATMRDVDARVRAFLSRHILA